MWHQHLVDLSVPCMEDQPDGPGPWPVVRWEYLKQTTTTTLCRHIEGQSIWPESTHAAVHIRLFTAIHCEAGGRIKTMTGSHKLTQWKYYDKAGILRPLTHTPISRHILCPCKLQQLYPALSMHNWFWQLHSFQLSIKLPVTPGGSHIDKQAWTEHT